MSTAFCCMLIRCEDGWQERAASILSACLLQDCQQELALTASVNYCLIISGSCHSSSRQRPAVSIGVCPCNACSTPRKYLAGLIQVTLQLGG